MGETQERPPRIMGTLRLTRPPVSLPAPEKAQPPAAAADPTQAPYAQRIVDLAMLRERFPTVFDTDSPLPLAIGIDQPLAKLLSKRRARFLLGWWCGRPEYRAAVAAGGSRYNLDGTPAGEISQSQRESASNRPVE